MLAHHARHMQERRQNHQLRQLFEPARHLLTPFMSPANSWSSNTLDFLARQVLLEHYPQMDQRDAGILIAACRQQTASEQG